jgi:hypothetical protein
VKIQDLFEKRAEPLPEPYNPKGIDPALMTLGEYQKFVDPDDKRHPDSAYDWSITDMNRHQTKPSEDYPQLVKRLKIKGIAFEIRLLKEKNRYIRRDGEDHARDADGNLIYLSDKEIAAKGMKTYDFMFGVFDEDGTHIATAQDEWGTMLIAVAREYRGFGLGPILGKIARSFEPGKTSGGFTHSGQKNFAKVHREFVRDALTTGRYRSLIDQGQITVERVKAIVTSAHLHQKPKKSSENFSATDPKDWLMMNTYGEFIVYDRKLKDMIDGPEEMEHWIDRMIIASVLVEGPSEFGIVTRFGGNTPKIKMFLMTCAVTYCANENVPLYVDPEDLPFVDKRQIDISEADMKSGYRRHLVRLKGQGVDYRPIAAAEEAFRKRFDTYDEFKNSVMERAHGKYR